MAHMDDSSAPIPTPDELPSGDPTQPPAVPGPSADVPAAPLVGLQYNLGEGMRVYNARDITIAPPPPPRRRCALCLATWPPSPAATPNCATC